MGDYDGFGMAFDGNLDVLVDSCYLERPSLVGVYEDVDDELDHTPITDEFIMSSITVDEANTWY